MSGRWRRAMRWAAGSLAVAALVVGAAPLAARWWIERRLATTTGLVASLRRVALAWEPLGVAAIGVELRTTAAAPAVLSAARIEMPFGEEPMRVIAPALSPAGFAAAAADRAHDERAGERRFALRDVELRAAVIEPAAPPRPAPAPRPIALPDVRILGLDVTVDADGAGFRAVGDVAVAGGTVGGRIRYRADGAASVARAHVRVRGVDAAALGGRLGPYVEAGRIGGRLRYRGRAGAAAGGAPAEAVGRVRGRLAAEGLRSRSVEGGWQLAAGTLDLRGLDLDLTARRFAVRQARLRAGELEVAPGEPAAPTSAAGAPSTAIASEEAWTGRIDRLDVRDLRLRSGAELPEVQLAVLEARALGGPAGTFALRAHPEGGGELRARGDLDALAPRLRADVDLDGVAVGPWIEPFVPGVDVAGSLAGRVELAGPPGVHGHGKVRLEDVRVAQPRDGDAGERFRAEAVTASLRGFTLLPPRLWLESAALDGPALTLVRGPDGLEPIASLTAAGAPAPANPKEGAGPDDGSAEARAALARLAERLGETPPLALPSVEVRAVVHRGTVRFRDETVAPAFGVEVGGIDGAVAAWGGPPWGTVTASLAGEVAGAGPLRAGAEISGNRFRLSGEVTALPLPPWSSYLAPAIGYSIASGRASASFELDWERAVRAPIRLALEDVALTRAGGQDRLGAMLGMPLERALGLMADSQGRTELVLRLEGDPASPALGLVDALPAALREAAAEAVTVPLFEGAELVGPADAEHVRLAPLRFDAGAAEVPAEHEATLERLAVVLRWDPVLVASLRGTSEGAEASAAGRGPSSDAGEPGAVAANGGPARESGDELAGRRAQAVRDRLVESLGVVADRVRIDPPARGTPGVVIELRPGEEAS